MIGSDDEDDDDLPLSDPPDPEPRAPGFAIPDGACDCHAHVIGTGSLFPLQDDRSFTPPEAPLTAYLRLLDRLGLARGVLVQPSVYGTDNRCLLQALALHRNRLRGVAVVPPDLPEIELTSLGHAGIRALRFNLLYRGGIALDHVETLARRIDPLRWHLEFVIDPARLPALAPRLAALPVEIVIDCLGYVPAATGIDHPGFRALLKLVAGGRCWVKLTGANRISAAAPFHDTIPLARALVETDPTRLVWGSDWPHMATPGPMVNDGDLLDLLPLWVPDARMRHLILVENPGRLYGFED